MSDERDKLIHVMNSLEADYRSGKISAEKYRYFRSKYEDKLNSIDAMEATKRIRSMQGKPSAPKKNKRKSKKPARDRKKQEQDLVQKYIINPKKDDAKYNKQKKSSMSSSTFKLIAILVLIVAFTAGVAYGIFNLDNGGVSEASPVAIVQDTAFPEIVEVNATNVTDTYNNTHVEDTQDDDKDQEEEVETTTETTTTTTTDSPSSSSQDSSQSSSSSQDSSQSSTPEPAPAPDSGSSDSGDGGGSDSGGSEG